MDKIRDWLRNDRTPATLYELLGRLIFDPDREGMLGAVRAGYAELLPYENHRDGDVSRRATQLLRELGRAEDRLTSDQKLKLHHDAILGQLRDGCAKLQSETRGQWGRSQLRDWLRQRGIHPDQLEATVRLLGGQQDETVDVGPHETQPLVPADEHDDGFALEEGLADGPSTADAESAGSPAAGDSPSEPVTAEVVPETESRMMSDLQAQAPIVVPATPPATPRRPRSPTRMRESGSIPSRAYRQPVSRKRRRQLVWVVGVSGAVWLLLVAVLWWTLGATGSWRGRLVQVRGHAGEIHLVVQLDAPLPESQIQYVEAVVADCRFAQELSDYVDGGERRQGGDRVVLEGRRRKAGDTRFTLIDSTQAILVTLSGIEKEGEPLTRAEVGMRRSRASFASKPKRTALANMLRMHPLPDENVGFAARFGEWRQQGVEVFASLVDRRAVPVEFPGTSSQDFTLYQADDDVYVVATLSENASPDRLILRGASIRRLQEPNAPVSAR